MVGWRDAGPPIGFVVRRDKSARVLADRNQFATGGFQCNGRSARCVTASADSPNATVPPKSLTPRDREAIASLLDDRYSPAKRPGPALLLGALSGLQLESNTKAFNCLGPHVGSPGNKIFKRFMYATPHPVMLFMTSAKIDCPVKPEHCHFILEQAQNG